MIEEVGDSLWTVTLMVDVDAVGPDEAARTAEDVIGAALILLEYSDDPRFAELSKLCSSVGEVATVHSGKMKI